jgi:hypothetical protein
VERETGAFIGFVAVSTDEETARIGRRDIAVPVAWRVGNPTFKGRFEGEEELGLRALRVVNVHDKVPNAPGAVFLVPAIDDSWFPYQLLLLLDWWLPLGYVYAHAGVELELDHTRPPFLKDTIDPSCHHNLEAHLHQLLDGYQGRRAASSARTPTSSARITSCRRPGVTTPTRAWSGRIEEGRWGCSRAPTQERPGTPGRHRPSPPAARPHRQQQLLAVSNLRVITLLCG